MTEEAYQQYLAEAGNWLQQSRIRMAELLVRRHQKGRGHLKILELGAGLGGSLPMLTECGEVDAIEIHPEAATRLRDSGMVRNLYTEAVPFDVPHKYDAIVALDVVEHLEDDTAALSWIHDHLVDGGILISTVPAYQFRAFGAALETGAVTPLRECGEVAAKIRALWGMAG